MAKRPAKAKGNWRPVLVGLGWAFLALGFAGVFVPVLPTTPFVILAAWCFSKGSDRLHEWLLHHKWFGKPLREWEKHGVIRLRAKILATVFMIPSFGYVSFFTDTPLWLKISMVCTGVAVLVYVWLRPSKPPR